MTTADLQDALIELFDRLTDARDEIEGEDDDIALADIARDMADGIDGITSVVSYDDAALLTSNEGVIVRTRSGAEFQVTIVQSRRGRGG